MHPHSVQHAIEWEEAAIPAVFPHLQGTWHLLNMIYVCLLFVFCLFVFKHSSQKKKQPKTEASFHDTVRNSSEISKKQQVFLYIKLSALLPPSSCLHSTYQQDAKETDWLLMKMHPICLEISQPWLEERAMGWLSFLPFLLSKNQRCHYPSLWNHDLRVQRSFKAT